MPLKEGTELRCLDIGGNTISVGSREVTAIRVGHEGGNMGWVTTAEIYRNDKLDEVRPLHNLDAYWLADDSQ